MTAAQTKPMAYAFIVSGLYLALVLFCVLSGCVRADTIPQTRTHTVQQETTVRLQVFCLMADPFEVGGVFYGGAGGSGVMIDKTHVLTAAHVIDCPMRPFVKAITADGRSYQMRIDKVWKDNDVARLVMESPVEKFRNITPPMLSYPVVGEPVCATTGTPERGVNCGPIESDSDEPSGDIYILGMAWHGNSGSPVWDHHGRLIGILVSGWFRPDGTPAGRFAATEIRYEYLYG